MNCADFERWLDAGLPAADAAAAVAHASGCPACARARETWVSLDALLGEEFALAPTAFADDVMSRIDARRIRALPPDLALPEPRLPLWIRVLREPSVVLGFLLVALLVGFRPRIIEAVQLAASSPALPAAERILDGPLATIAAGLPLLLVVLFVSVPLYLGGAALSRGTGGRARPAARNPSR